MTQLQVVLEYFCEAHLAPSAIDRLLKLPKGKAHELIVGWWADCREGKPRAPKGGDL